MTFWAIVPIKPLRRGKSRLATVLTQDERTDFNRKLFIHTLSVLNEIPEIEQVLVVSRDQEALSLAREYGARTVQENGTPELNIALSRATIVAKTYTPQGVLILPTDLPLLSNQEVSTLLEYAKKPPVVVIAPDRWRQGTNALVICPAGLIDYGFGPGSFQRHCERAIQAGVKLEVCDLSALSLDIDLPEDLDLYKHIREETAEKSNEPTFT